MDVRPVPGLEHLPYAEVWLREPDELLWREAAGQARALGKTALEVWTSTETPAVVPFLEARGYSEVRRYVISELDVAAAPDPGEPAFPLTTLAERPELRPAVYELARVAYADQPGRGETILPPYEEWRSWSVEPHPADAFFIAAHGDDVLGYGYLAEEDGTWTHGFAAVARPQRGRGIAGAIKRAQIAWARAHGVRALRTANEVRLGGLRALNERLGYRPLYEEVVLRGPLASQHDDAAS
jgi:GNAT superfamily N-acetyltransferase